MTRREQELQRDREMDVLLEQSRQRAAERARAYWANPPAPRTEDQEREFQRQRAEVARWSGCPISQVVWHGPDQCWSFR